MIWIQSILLIMKCFWVECLYTFLLFFYREPNFHFCFDDISQKKADIICHKSFFKQTFSKYLVSSTD